MVLRLILKSKVVKNFKLKKKSWSDPEAGRIIYLPEFVGIRGILKIEWCYEFSPNAVFPLASS